VADFLTAVLSATFLHEIYARADAAISGRATVPVLWDTQRGTIVNNESADILRMMNAGFGDLADDSFDLYPAGLREEIDALNALPGSQQRRLSRRLRHHTRSLRGSVS
jgi:putative glutathione S-transferase